MRLSQLPHPELGRGLGVRACVFSSFFGHECAPFGKACRSGPRARAHATPSKLAACGCRAHHVRHRDDLVEAEVIGIRFGCWRVQPSGAGVRSSSSFRVAEGYDVRVMISKAKTRDDMPGGCGPAPRSIYVRPGNGDGKGMGGSKWGGPRVGSYVRAPVQLDCVPATGIGMALGVAWRRVLGVAWSTLRAMDVLPCPAL